MPGRWSLSYLSATQADVHVQNKCATVRSKRKVKNCLQTLQPLLVATVAHGEQYDPANALIPFVYAVLTLHNSARFGIRKNLLVFLSAKR